MILTVHFSIDGLFQLCLENGIDLLDRHELYKRDIFIWFEVCFIIVLSFKYTS